MLKFIHGLPMMGIRKLPKFRKNLYSGFFPETPDISARKLVDVHPKGLNNNCEKCQNDLSSSSRGIGGPGCRFDPHGFFCLKYVDRRSV